MPISLFNRLRKRAHREVALLQDEAVDIVFAVSDSAVLHGGTAIWRCYKGNRFSDDLDFYLPKKNSFGQLFSEKVKSRGLLLLKFKQTENTLFAKVSNGLTEIQVEAAFRKPKSHVVAEYEKADGARMHIRTLSREDLLLEKADAFIGRRLVRDLFDVFFLSKDAQLSGEERKTLVLLVERFRKPLDEKNLEAIVYSGIAPSAEQMMQALKARFSK